MLLASADLQVPPWALTAFVALFFFVVGIAGWGLRALGRRFHEDLEKVNVKLGQLRSSVDDYNGRLIRLETVIFPPGGAGDGGHQYPRAGTPPPG